MRLLCSGNERLGRNAAIVQAIAAHLAFFEQDDASAKLRGGCGNRESAGARANNRKIIDHGLPRQRFASTGTNAATPRAARARRICGVIMRETERSRLQGVEGFCARHAS